MNEPTLRPALAALALLLLPVLYVGSYAVMLAPAWTSDHGGYVRQAEYRIGGVVAEWFYYPVNLVDRQVRPDVWNEVMVVDFGL